jgi:hypothetical protein
MPRARDACGPCRAALLSPDARHPCADADWRVRERGGRCAGHTLLLATLEVRLRLPPSSPAVPCLPSASPRGRTLFCSLVGLFVGLFVAYELLIEYVLYRICSLLGSVRDRM